MNHRIYNLVYQSPWNITGGAWEALNTSLQERNTGNFDVSGFFVQREKMTIDQRGIAVVDIRGALGNLSEMEKSCGATDYADLQQEFALAAEQARGLVLTIDSPGGMCAGNIETGGAFAAFPGPKAVHINGLGCSAAYLIAAAADRIVVSPSAEIGSIGTIMPFVDRSGQWEKEGLKADYIVSGKLKGAGFPPSLDENQRASLQEIVDDFAGQFKDHVSRFRSIDADDMQGQAFVAPRGVAKNLADQIGTAQDAYEWVAGRVS